MPVLLDLTLTEGNTESIRLAITDDDTGAAVNLTGTTIEFYIKPDRSTPDDDPSVTVLSTTTGEATITDGPAGVCIVDVPAQPAGTRWRRVDVITGSTRKTAVYGPLHVRDV